MNGVKNNLIDAKLHDASLEVNAKIAEQASILCLQYGWDYDRAEKYVLKMNPNFEELSKRGFISALPEFITLEKIEHRRNVVVIT